MPSSRPATGSTEAMGSYEGAADHAAIRQKILSFMKILLWSVGIKKDLYTLPAGRTAAAKYTGLAYITIDAVTILCGFTGQLAAGPRPPV